MLAILLVALSVQLRCVSSATFTHATLAELRALTETCKGDELCGPTHPKDIPSAKCVCESDCALYGDCCRNSPFFNPADTFASPFACRSQLSGPSFYMIEKCPFNSDKRVRKLCEEPKPSPDPVADNLPVTIPSADGLLVLTYQNAHCAKCNGANLSAGEMWTPVVQCFDNLAVEIDKSTMRMKWNETNQNWMLLSNEVPSLYECEIGFSAPDKYLDDLRMCKGDGFIDTCLPHWKGTRDQQLCESYTAFVVANGTSYRNVYCAKCNDEDVTKVDCVDLRVRGFGRSATFWSLLRAPEKDRQKCGENTVFDEVFGKCRYIVCPTGQEECSEGKDDTVSNSSNSTIHTCKRFALEKDAFELLNNNSTVLVPRYNRNYTKGQFLINAVGQVEICVKDLPEKFDGYSFAVGVVTVVGLGLSIFFLVLHLCAVAMVHELRNHSGLNLSSLCVALLGAYISFIAGAFLSGDGTRKACTIVGVLVYYFFMSAFFWMLVIAYDVWRVLRGAVRHFRASNGRQYCRFTLYSLFAWGVPALFTATALIVETSALGNVDTRFQPHFGQGSCWFTRQLSLVVFFAMPLAIIMTLNIVFFVASAFLASSTRSSSSSLNVTGQKRDFRLYLRLAILLGLTWVMGLLAAVMDYEPLWVCFVLFNTLQGVFIFCTFTCTSKVLKSLKKQHPWANSILGSLKRPTPQPSGLRPSSSDVGFSQSTSETAIKSNGNVTTIEALSQARKTPSPLPPRKSSTHLEVTSPPRQTSS